MGGQEQKTTYCRVLKIREDTQSLNSDWLAILHRRDEEKLNELLAEGWSVASTTPVTVEGNTSGVLFHLVRPMSGIAPASY